jgi:hypothetical protein
MYMSEVKTGMTSCEDKEPTIVKESAGTALVEIPHLLSYTDMSWQIEVKKMH